MFDFQSKYAIHLAADTTIGGRKENQDNLGFIDTPLGCLAVLCDGMGGGPGGKTASGLAIDTIVRTVMSATPHDSREEILRNAIANAQYVLSCKVKEVPQLNGMGSTVVAILINGESAVIVHLGDSRCYRIQGKDVKFQTTDHSLVSELVQHKTLTMEEARTSPQSNVITRGLGSMSNHTPDISIVPYCKGDRFVLCSDGVWGIMPHESIINLFASPQSINYIVDNIQKEVDNIGFAKGGGHDNHTLIMIETLTDSKLKEKMSKQIIAIIATLSLLLLISLGVNAYHGLSKPKEVDNTELKYAYNEIERLKPFENRYNELRNSNDPNIKALVNSAAIIDSLKETVDSLNAKICRLEKKVKGGGDKKRDIDDLSAEEIAEKVKSLFDKLKDYNANSETAAVTEKEAIGQEIISYLKDYNAKTNKDYNSTIEAICRILDKTKGMTIYLVEDQNGTFKSTKYAITEIKKLKKKFENRKKK